MFDPRLNDITNLFLPTNAIDPNAFPNASSHTVIADDTANEASNITQAKQNQKLAALLQASNLSANKDMNAISQLQKKNAVGPEDSANVASSNIVQRNELLTLLLRAYNLSQNDDMQKENIPLDKNVTIVNDQSEGNEKKGKSKKDRKSTKKPNTKVSDRWIHLDNFSLEEESYKKLMKNGRVQHFTMTSFLNKNYPDVPCVLQSFGKYNRSFERLTLRYKCSHSHDGEKDCSRQYKVFQVVNNTFELFRNDTEVTHNTETKIVGHVRGEHRNEVAEKLATMTVTEYREECERNADKVLLAKGNLQECLSDTTAEKIRSEKMLKMEFDKDDLIDLLLMKIYQDLKKYEEKGPQSIEINDYIRRIGLDPFFVTMCSEEQLKCLKMLEEFITVYIDATGGVIRFGKKKVFYYAGVTPDTSMKLNPGERHKVLPLMECISSAHDSFNISIWLMEFKVEFQKHFPTLQWPIKHAVSDFSYAILNAICFSWNQMKLIDYINCIYDALLSNTPLSEIHLVQINTFLHICCCHLMKNFSKDVKEYFPNMDAQQQNVLKEIFAGMFGITELETLANIWKNLSMILVSKYAGDDVEAALQQLCKIMVSEEKLLENHENHNEDEEIAKYFAIEKVPCTDEHKAIYKNSKFYQHFKSIMSKESFATKNAPMNAFYSPTFATMILQKYVTVLPLWTCFDRKANSYAECHFKDTKKTMISKQVKYGPAPLKPGRFIKIIQERVASVTNSMQQRIPKYRNTGQKRKLKNNDEASVAKKSKIASSECISNLKSYLSFDSEPNSVLVPASAQILDLYKQFQPSRKCSPSPTTKERSRSPSIQKKSPSPSSKKTPEAHTQYDDKIDDLQAQEQWNRKPKRKYTHFLKQTLTKVQKSPTVMKKLFSKVSHPVKSSSKDKSCKKLPNGLIDHPETYLAPQQQTIIVARNSNKKLNQNDYSTLTPDNVLSVEMIDYVVRMLITQTDSKNIQLEISVNNQFDFHVLKKWEQNLKISLFLNIFQTKCTLVIVNWKKQTFYYIDPTQQYPEYTEVYSYFQYLIDQNKISKKFSEVRLEHQITEDMNAAVAVLNFIDQYLQRGTIDAPFDAIEYRVELQHRILRSSTKMTTACIICGSVTKGSWVQCDCCKRWTHCQCINKTEEQLKNDTIHYFCVICVANTPKADLHARFKEVDQIKNLATIPEEFVQPEDNSLISSTSEIIDIESIDSDNAEDAGHPEL